jgi:aspartokinase
VELVKREASILSADPREVPTAHPVRSLTYEEAEELSEFGARVLHPMTVPPARVAGLELRVRSLQDPKETTVVGPRIRDAGVRAVTVSPTVALFRMRFPGARGRTGVLSEICRRLSVGGVPVLQAFTSAAVVSVVVPSPLAADARRALSPVVEERGGRLDPAIPVALLAAVGSGAAADLPRFPPAILRASEGISATRASVTIALPARRGADDLRRLHAALLESRAGKPRPLHGERRPFGRAPARGVALPRRGRVRGDRKRTS